MRKKDLKKWFSIYLKGFAMGSADAVPGVSGGTIALITGIYERLIGAITSLHHGAAFRTLQHLKEGDLEGIERVFSDVDGYFLTVLSIGIISALVLVLRFMHLLIQKMPIPTFGFFFGLIAASVVALWPKIEISDNRNKFVALAGFLAAFLTSGYAAGSLGHSFPVIFLAGMFAVSAMILPGISGSLILIILGQYEYMSGALTDFTDALIVSLKSGELQAALDAAPPVLVFVSGAVIGLFTVAHTVQRALETHRNATMVFLVSLMAGALRAPVVEVDKVLVEAGSSWVAVLPEFIPAAFVGGLVIYLVDRKAGTV